VATAAKDRLSFPLKPAQFQIENDDERDERDRDCEHEQNGLHVIAHPSERHGVYFHCRCIVPPRGDLLASRCNAPAVVATPFIVCVLVALALAAGLHAPAAGFLSILRVGHPS